MPSFLRPLAGPGTLLGGPAPVKQKLESSKNYFAAAVFGLYSMIFLNSSKVTLGEHNFGCM